MTAALIGLIAVVAGAVLSGAMSDIIERRKRSAAGRSAARVLATELDVAATKLLSATSPGVAHPGWWTGTPARRAWESQYDALADLGAVDEIARVGRAYALLEGWVAEREAARETGTEAPTSEQAAELRGDVEVLRSTARRLRALADQSRARRLTWLGAAVVTALLLVLALVPRDNVNSQTVAAALQSVSGRNALARCDHTRSHWTCAVYQLTAPRTLCESGRAGPTATSGTPAGLSGCGVAGKPQAWTVAADGNHLFATPGAAERAANRLFARVPDVDKRSLFERALRVFDGKSATGR